MRQATTCMERLAYRLHSKQARWPFHVSGGFVRSELSCVIFKRMSLRSMYQCRDARYDEVEFGETRSHQRLPRFVVCGGMWAPEAQSTDRSVDWLQPRALVAPCHLAPVVGPVKHGLFMSAVTYA